MDKIYNMGKQIDFNNSTYYFKSENLIAINFIGFRGPLNISIEKQKKIKSNLDLSAITTGNPKAKSKEQLDTIKNIKNLYKSKEEIMKLHNDYAKIKSEAMYRAKLGTGLKILTPKQMLQRWPIAVAQVKAGNIQKLNQKIS